MIAVIVGFEALYVDLLVMVKLSLDSSLQFIAIVSGKRDSLACLKDLRWIYAFS